MAIVVRKRDESGLMLQDTACSGNEWAGPRKIGEVSENDRSAVCRALSSMHDNQLLSVQFFKRRVGLDQCVAHRVQIRH